MIGNINVHLAVLIIGMTLTVSSFIELIIIDITGTMNLQSSINISHNLGTISLSINYCCGLLLSVFATPLLLCNLGAKWTLILGEIGFTCFTFGNFYSGLATMVPGSVIGSMGEAFIWPAGLFYINQLFIHCQRTAAEDEKPEDNVKNVWFGRYYAVIKTCVIWGNLLAYAVLYGARKLDVNTASNSTFYDYQTCGANFCKVTKVLQKNIHAYIPKSKTSLYILLAVYAGIQICAVLLHIFCLPVLNGTKNPENRVSCSCAALKTTLKSFANHLISTDQLLMTPFCFYYGFFISFCFSDFPRAFVSCSMGVQQVGLVMTVYGVFNSLAAYLSGKISQKLGLPLIFSIRAVLDLATCIILLSFQPTVSSRYWAYGFAVLLGSGDGIWQPIIALTFALYFPDRTELAFGAITMWQVFAMAIGFVMSGRVCLSVRMYLLIGNLAVACCCYVIAEKRQTLKANEETTQLTAAENK